MSSQESKDYARGYAAGRKRQQVDIDQEAERKRENENWNRAFLTALPFAMSAEGWARGEKPIKTIADRVILAQNVADEAIRYMRRKTL